jgi:zinc transport system substrate-binding protein
LGSCADNNGRLADDGKTTIIASVFPAYDFARQIAGDLANVEMLCPPSVDTHMYEPTPKDILKIENCDVFIYIGGESETWIENILDSLDKKNKVTLKLIDHIDAVQEEIVEGMDAEESDGAYDEHIWTSPQNAVKMTRAISDVLRGADSINADTYTANADLYCEKLVKLDEAFRGVVDNAARTTLIFGDRFPFRYFTDEYGLTYYAAFPGCSSETEPIASTMKFLIDKVNAENIPVVFNLEFSNEKVADVICSETNAKKLKFHSCHNVSDDDFKNSVGYIELMMNNVNNLRLALN